MLAPGTIRREETVEDFREIFGGANVAGASYFNMMTHFDFKTLLPALLQVEDRVSMAHGLESRVPFLDHPIVEFAATAPLNVKFLDGELKRWLRVAFSNNCLGQLEIGRIRWVSPCHSIFGSKGGQGTRFIGDTFSSNAARSRPYLAKNFSLDEILDTQSIYGRNLWALLSLELWQQQFID